MLRLSPTPSLSSSSLYFARAVLEELARADILRVLGQSHHKRDIALPPDPESLPLGDRLAADYRGMPLASSLGAEDIAFHITRGVDPWAEDLHGRPHRRMSRPPLRDMQAALRILALVTTSEELARIVTPGTVTTVIIPSSHERELVWRAMTDLLPALATVFRARGMDWTRPETPVYGSDGSGSKSDEARNAARFAENVEAAIAKGAPVLALASHRHDMPDVGQVLCDMTMPLPPLTRQMVVEMLRVTHSVTGQIAEDAILGRLPVDCVLASLHPSLLAHAFAATSTLRVADRLAAISERSGTRSGTTLDDIALPAAVRDDLSRILDDLAAWNSGTLDWSEVSASIMLHGARATARPCSLPGSPDRPEFRSLPRAMRIASATDIKATICVQ